jgi:Ser/Thr protein kinase RdoA (MazF antagonist)
MNMLQMNSLFEQLQLGHIESEPERVTGGLLHRMWRVSTESGYYAIKQLNPEVLKRTQARSDYINSEKISSAYARQGVPAIPAITHHDTPLHNCGEDTIMIFPWMDGETLPVGTVDPDRSFMIGLTLAALHSYQPNVDGLPTPIPLEFDHNRWRDSVGRARALGLPWKSDIRSYIPVLIGMSVEYERVSKQLQEELVISHRDMDQKNVLWPDSKSPAIIDWESAGLTNPAQELFDTALNWSGYAIDDPGLESFKSLIKGYRVVYKAPQTSGFMAFMGCLGNWMEWLEFNIERSTSDSIGGDEKQLANREVKSTLEILQLLYSRSQQLISHFERAIL